MARFRGTREAFGKPGLEPRWSQGDKHGVGTAYSADSRPIDEGVVDLGDRATLAIRFGLKVADIVQTFHPYLTMAEGLKLAALTFDKEVAKLSCCAT